MSKLEPFAAQALAEQALCSAMCHLHDHEYRACRTRITEADALVGDRCPAEPLLPPPKLTVWQRAKAYIFLPRQ